MKSITKMLSTLVLTALVLFGVNSQSFAQVYCYVPVTETLTDWSGEYLIAYTDLGSGKINVLDSLSNSGTKYGTYVNLYSSYADGVIPAAAADAMKVTIASSTNGYTLCSQKINYLGWVSGNSLAGSATVSSNNYEWNLSMSEGVLTITNANTPARKLQWNATSPRFATYTSTQTSVMLYKRIAASSVAMPTITPASGMFTAPFNVEISCSTSGASIYYTTDGTTPSNASTLYTAPFQVSATTTVKAIAIVGSDNSSVATASYVFPEVKTIAEFKATTGSATYAINNVTYVYRNGLYMFVKDATGGLLVYDGSNKITTTYTEGDVIPSIVGTKSVYQGLTEFVPAGNSAEATSNTGSVMPTVVTAAQLAANYADYEGQLVTIENVTFTENKTFTTTATGQAKFAQGNDTLLVYNRFKTLDMSVAIGDVRNVTGFAAIYGTQVQLYARDNNDIAEPQQTNPDSITVTVGTGTVYTNGHYAPICSFYKNAYTQTIYPLSEIGYAGQINSIALDCYSAETTSEKNTFLTLKVYMGVTSKGEFASTSDWVAEAALTEVYSGTNVVVGATTGLQTLVLDTPYNYDASGNLVIAVSHTVANYSSSMKFYYTTVDNSFLYRGNDSDASFANYPTSSATAKQSYRANVQLGMTNTYVPCMPVGNLAVTEASITSTSATITWTAGGSESTWNIQYGPAGFALGQGTIISNLAATSYDLTNLLGNTLYDVYVQAACSPTDLGAWSMVSFRTLCPEYQSVPYAENFDSWPAVTTNTNNNLPTCWSFINTSANSSYKNYPILYSSTSYSNSGSISMKFYQNKTYGNGQYAVMPAMQNVSTLQMEFSARKYSTVTTYTNAFEVGVMSDPADASTFTTVATISPSSTTHEPFTVYFNNYTGDGNYIAIRQAVPTTTYAGCYIDDISVSVAPTCFVCTNLVCSAVMQDTAVLNWTENGNATAWELEYRKVGSTSTNGVIAINSRPAIISGLDRNTLYEYHVRSVCSATDLGDWSVWSEFRTACADYQTVPYVENFESWEGVTSGAVNNLPACWSYINTATSTSYSGYPIVYSGTLYANDGTNSMKFYQAKTQNAPQYAIMPAMQNVSALQMEFYARKYSTTTAYTNTIEIGVMTDPADENTFTLVSSVTPTDIAYELFTVYFNSYSGDGNYIAIRQPIPTTSSAGCYIDNIEVTLAPSCFICTGLECTGVEQSSATLAWVESGNATTWNIEYRLDGDTLPGTAVVATSNPYTLTGLTANTPYEFRVQSICSATETADWSTWTSFRTACAAYMDLPYAEDFDSWTGSTSSTVNNLPACWSYINTSTYSSYLGNPIIYSGSTYAASGTNSLKFYIYNYSATNDAQDQYAILPAAQNVSALQMAFKARANSTGTAYTSTFEVGVMSDPSDASSFVTVQTITPTSTVYADYIVYFENYTGSGNNIAFRMTIPSTSYAGCYIDNIVVSVAPLYKPVLNVHANNITNSGATINWTAQTSEPSWQIQFDTAGFALGTGTTVTSSATTYALTNLYSATEYDVYVRGAGPTEFGEWVGPYTFRTECDAMTLAIGETFSENFDSMTGSTSGTTNNLPACWNYINTSTYSSYKGYPIVYSTSSYAQSQPNSLRFYISNYSATYDAQDEYAILPPMNNVSAMQMTFSARAYMTTSAYTNVLEVGVMTDRSDPSTFVMVSSFTFTENTYSDYVVTFPETATGNYIAMRALVPPTNYLGINVDNIVVAMQAYNVAISDDIMHGVVAVSDTTYAVGSTVTINAVADNGYELTSLNVYKTTDPTTTVTVTDNTFVMPAYDVTISATFSPIVYNIAVDAAIANGTVTPSATTANLGATITLTATANEGYQFVAYNVYKTGDAATTVTVTNNAFTMPAYDVTVSATFSAIEYTIAVDNSIEHGSVAASATTATMGAAVTLTANADEGYQFVAYNVYKTGDASTTVTVTNNAFTMPAYDVTVSATFSAVDYAITVATVEHGTVIASATTATMGAAVTLTANADEGYQFVAYNVYKTGDTATVVTVADNAFTMPAYDVTVSATFSAIEYTITVDNNIEHGSIAASVATATIGETVTLTADADAEYELVAFNVYKTGDESVVVTVTDNSFVMPAYDVTVSATFTFDALGENAAANAAIYPNPTRNMVKVIANGMTNITIYNAMGQMISNVDMDADEYEYHFDEAGVYMMQISTTTGTDVKRVVVVK